MAISNSRLVSLDERGVTFRWKDYRDRGTTRHKTMTLDADEFMRRFLLHVLPPPPPVIGAAETADVTPVVVAQPKFVCRHCGAVMVVVDTFARGQSIRAPPLLSAAP